MYYGWLVVAASTVIYMVFLGAIYSSYGLFVMPVSEELGLSRADANTGLVILSLGTAVQAPFLGRLVDKWSVRRVMALGAVVFAATYAVIATSHSLWLNAAILALLFPIAAQGACSLPAPLLIARWFKVHRGRAMAMAHLGLSLGGVVVPPIVAALIESFGWRAALTITGAGAGATLLAIALVVREWPGPGDREGGAEARDPDGGADASPQPVAAILRNPQFWTINLSCALVISTSTALMISLAPLGRAQGLSMMQAASLISTMSGCGIAGKLMLVVLADRFDRVLLLTFAFVAGAAANAAMILGDGYGLLLAAAGALGFINSAMPPTLNALLADRFGAASFGTTAGLAQPIQAGFSILSIRYAGEVYDRTGGYDALFLTFVIVQLVAGATIFSTRFLPAAAAHARPDTLSVRPRR